MSKDKRKKILAAVFAHPDDESFTMGGTLAKYAKENVETILICATSGQMGTRRNLKKGQDLGKIREKELKDCAKILGIKNLYLLHYQDGHLHQANKSQLEAKIANILSQFDPDLVVTFGPDGLTGHIDHVAICSATTNVFDKLFKNNNKRLLYVAPIDRVDLRSQTGLPDRLSATKAKYEQLHKADEVDALVDINGSWQDKLEALACHDSQFDAQEYRTKLEKKPMILEGFSFSRGKQFSKKPANDLFEGLGA